MSLSYGSFLMDFSNPAEMLEHFTDEAYNLIGHYSGIKLETIIYYASVCGKKYEIEFRPEYDGDEFISMNVSLDYKKMEDITE